MKSKLSPFGPVSAVRMSPGTRDTLIKLDENFSAMDLHFLSRAEWSAEKADFESGVIDTARNIVELK
jgi:hypothetical protein